VKWAEVLIGALAAGGLLGILKWIQGLFGRAEPPEPVSVQREPSKALQEARAVIVEQAEEDQEEIREAVESDAPEHQLADLLNKGRS
jgi:hypothetical protein